MSASTVFLSAAFMCICQPRPRREVLDDIGVVAHDALELVRCLLPVAHTAAAYLGAAKKQADCSAVQLTDISVACYGSPSSKSSSSLLIAAFPPLVRVG